MTATQTYSTELAGIDSKPAVKAAALSAYGAKLKRYRASINMATQDIASTIQLARIPAGETFAFGILNASATLGSATLAIGITSNTGKYLAASTFTAAAPTLFAAPIADEVAAAYSAEEDIFLTIGAAPLPGSGTLVIDIFTSSAT